MAKSNKYDLKPFGSQGITIVFHRAQKLFELVGSGDPAMPRSELSKVMVGMLKIPIYELALAYTEFQFRPETVRAEFGVNGQFLYVS